jgi:hypothetical protein
MKKSLLVAAGLLVASASQLALAGGIQLARSVPYGSDSAATDAVKSECGLEASIPTWIADSSGGAVVLSDNPSGKVLTARITHVMAPGGGPFSGPKSVRVEGELKEGGKVVGSFAARRSTTRGGYGTCSMLAIAAKVVAEDIGKWSAEPTMDAKLGEIKN